MSKRSKKKVKFKRIRTGRLVDCDKKLVRQFHRLNLGWSGNLRDTLESVRFDSRAYVAYILDEKDRVAAWVLLSPDRYDWKDKSKQVTSGFYTKKKFRRMGLGTKLVKAASKIATKKLKKKIDYYPHDDTAESFFNKCENTGLLTHGNSIK